MTLLDDIVAGATGDKAVASLLRQLKVLASRTGAEKLSAWVDRELGGYPDANGLPAYRGPFATAALGHFIGSFGRELQNLAIPQTTFPEELRNGTLFNFSALQPIAEVEQMASDGGQRQVWSADAVRYYNFAVQRGDVARIVTSDMSLVGVIQPVPVQILTGIVDTVRTRVLDLVLELEEAAPDAGQRDATPDTNERASNVINNYSFFGSTNVAIDSTHVTQIVTPPAPGDVVGLVRYLAAAGVDVEKLVELRAALRQDEMDDARDDAPGRWQRVRAWFALASTDLTTTALGGVIGTAATTFLAR